MCSINGFTWRDETLVRRMNTVTKHRGPDGTGVFVADGISLGHNRLAIIDLSPAGAQPMKSGDGRFVIVFNGEIYNYRELKRELSGYQWRSESDTEVILAAYERWGIATFSRLSGIFAFALWDTKEGKLLLVRDPMGVKPLYYCERGGRVIFSSEIKAILEYGDIPRRLDPLALNLYLRVNYTPAPLTMFSGIRKLPAGHLLVWKEGKFAIENYLSKEQPTHSRAPRAALAAELRRKVRESVKRQLVSDRPVGLYLSGGIDSNAVLEAMTAAQGRVESFSVGFELTEAEQREKFNADFSLARRVAKHFGATHHEVLLSPREIPQLFEESVYHLDEPVANATSIPMLKLARFAKKRVTVVLGGDGGDELFGGYERYRLALLSSCYRRMPETVRAACALAFPALRKLDTAEGIERFAQFNFLKENKLRPLLSQFAYHPHSAREFFKDRFFSTARAPFETQFMKADRESWLTDESLLRTDKMSMASGLEARVPLLDLPLVAFADAIPLRQKVSLFRTKIILKEAFKGVLPPELFHQPKRGWFSPAAKWLRYPHIAAFARAVLSPDYAEATRRLFNWNAIRARLEAHLRGEYHLTELWALLTLQLWARRFTVSP
jgi:asparagine synthase (glutamine-hydrolysing)